METKILSTKEELKELILSCVNGKITESELNNKELYNYSSITDLTEMFINEDIEKLPSWDASNVETINGLFTNCEKLKEIPKLYLPKVKDLSNMCYGCKSLKNVELNLTKEAKFAYTAFADCKNLESLKIKGLWKLKDMTGIIEGSTKKLDFKSLNHTFDAKIETAGIIETSEFNQLSKEQKKDYLHIYRNFSNNPKLIKLAIKHIDEDKFNLDKFIKKINIQKQNRKNATLKR